MHMDSWRGYGIYALSFTPALWSYDCCCVTLLVLFLTGTLRRFQFLLGLVLLLCCFDEYMLTQVRRRRLSFLLRTIGIHEKLTRHTVRETTMQKSEVFHLLVCEFL